MISNRCHYALQAMLELSLRHRQGPATIGEIAEAQAIPARFLEAILRQLKQAGLATSARGKEGGYTLARPPHEITMLEVIQLFEGPLIHDAGKEPAADAADGVPDVFTPVWREAETSLDRLFAQIDFDTLVEHEHHRAHIIATDFTI